MLFNFLKYIRPVWYFNLKPEKWFSYFPGKEELESVNFFFEEDDRFLSSESKRRDLAWRAFHKGYINPNENNESNFWNKTNMPIEDEYLFLRKNFHKGWVLYVFLIRLLSFNNPLKEYKAFGKTKKVNRENYFQDHIEYPEYHSFSGELLASNPKVSVIIPTLNRYEYLKDVFRDLEKQEYKNFEVLVVDQTEPFYESVYQGWNLDIKFWFQEEKALWKARNSAIQKAEGDYILLYDDDSLVEPNWISEHLKTLDFFKADISSGVSISVIGAEVPKHYSFFRWSDQLDTGNVLIKREVFHQIGLFDRQFEKQRMGDGEFGLRAYLAGFKNISNPKAKRIHLKVGKGGLRQMGSWDGWRPKKVLSPRPIPSVLYLSRKYFGNKASRTYVLINILPSVVPLKYKSNRYFKLISFLFFPLIFPLIGIQVWRSWYLSGQKLRQGPLIEKLT